MTLGGIMPYKDPAAKLAYMKKYNATKEVKERSAQWYQDNKEHKDLYDRRRILKLKYNITPEDYNRMLDQQNGCCKICNVHYLTLNRILAVDHCHTTGRVRSLLCNNCNTGLGLFKDNIELMKKAIDYLQE
jgi:hypothetical protein